MDIRISRRRQPVRRAANHIMNNYVMGIDVGGTNVKIMIMDEQCRVVAKQSIPTWRENGYEEISDRIIASAKAMMSESDIFRGELRAVGMGLPGTVDTKRSVTVRLSALHWDGFNPCEKIGKYFDTPYFIENDANINAYGEYIFGENGKTDNLALVTLGTGVGCGIIIDGKIAGGANNMAAELGHMIINADGGALCLCGKRGHLEGYCAGVALARDAQAMMEAFPDTVLHRYMRESGDAFDNTMITRGVEEGDRVCKELIDRYTWYLSVGLANVMTMFNPEVILLGGGISNAGNIILEPVNRHCREMVLSERSYCPVKKATLGSEAGMYGACALAAQKMGWKV